MLHGWGRRPTGLSVGPADVPLPLSLGLTAMAAGILVSGIRDVYAVRGFPQRRASWPWRHDSDEARPR